MNNWPQLWIWAIIENDKWEILVVEEKETREDYSKFKWDISVPFGKVWDNHKNENIVDALYREVLEETGLDLTENKYLPCEFWDLLFFNMDIEIIFKVRLFHVKLNWVLKKYEEKVFNNEVWNAYFISKEDFGRKILEWWIRAWADEFYNLFQWILKIENNNFLEPILKKWLLDKFYNEQKNIVFVWPWSKYNLKKLEKNEWK